MNKMHPHLLTSEVLVLDDVPQLVAQVTVLIVLDGADLCRRPVAAVTSKARGPRAGAQILLMEDILINSPHFLPRDITCSKGLAAPR